MKGEQRKKLMLLYLCLSKEASKLDTVQKLVTLWYYMMPLRRNFEGYMHAVPCLD